MNKTKLVLFEGIPGSGKTTTATRLYDYLTDRGLETALYLEGCEHPIDLPFYAFLTPREFDDLLCLYSAQAEWFGRKFIMEEDYVLVPYKIPPIEPPNDDAMAYLKTKEICYSGTPAVPFDVFQKVFLKRFERFAAQASAEKGVTIMESVLFQHQIHDINRMYPTVGDDEIIDHLIALAHTVHSLNPVLLYISQDSVRQSLCRTAEARSNPKWSTEESVRYWERRKGIELKAIDRLPIETHVLDNSDYDWDRLLDSVISLLS